MIPPTFRSALLHARCVAATIFLAASSAFAQSTLDTIGVTALRARDASLTGAGVFVAQPEAPLSAGGNNFEVNTAIQPNASFTYTSAAGTTTVYSDGTIGTGSSHADSVGAAFFGGGGVAPGVSGVDSYEASYFYNNLIVNPTNFRARVVNQSFIFANATLAQQQDIDRNYDNYVATHLTTVFVSGVGNNDVSAPQPEPPSTAYNGIAVGAFGGASSVGPTQDGRSKPDITAPGPETSFSTPLVSGAAAVLIQAGTRGDGGAGTAASATDARTIKALLLTGANKPADWAHTATRPLDVRYGAGVLNVNTSYTVLSGGLHGRSTTTSTNGSLTKAPQNSPAISGTDVIEPLQGYNFTTITETGAPGTNFADHYYFTLPTSVNAVFSFTATLTWNRQTSTGIQSNLNDLDLYLLNRTNNAVIASSISTVDNVEHIFLQGLAPGSYDLEVQKDSLREVTRSETYSLAFIVVPEPGTAWLVLAAVGSLGIFARPRSTSVLPC